MRAASSLSFMISTGASPSTPIGNSIASSSLRPDGPRSLRHKRYVIRETPQRVVRRAGYLVYGGEILAVLVDVRDVEAEDDAAPDCPGQDHLRRRAAEIVGPQGVPGGRPHVGHRGRARQREEHRAVETAIRSLQLDRERAGLRPRR